MNSSLRSQVRLSAFGNVATIREALSKLFALQDIQAQLLDQLSQSLSLRECHLGESIYTHGTPDNNSASVQDEQNANGLYLVCAGRVRLLCPSEEHGRDVSVAVLHPGEVFGGEESFCESSIPYHAIAASSVQIAAIPSSVWQEWIQAVPQLEPTLKQQFADRDRLMFLKRYARTGPLCLTNDQIQSSLSELQTIRIEPGQSIRLESAGSCWLRQGGIETGNGTLEVGSSWSETATDWIAKTQVVIYQIPLLAGEPSQTGKNGDEPEPLPRSQRSRPAILIQSTPQSEPNSQSSSSSNRSPNDSSNPSNVIEFPRPKRVGRLKWQYPFIEQQSSSDCGVACLAMVSQFWGTRFDLNSLRELAKVGRSGASLKHLAAAAELIGYHTRPIRASLGALADQNQPWIAHWQADHYVVVYRVRRDRVLVADPARGKDWLDRRQFLEGWTGFALLLDPTEQLKANATEKPSLGRFWELLWVYRSVLWQIIGISLLIQLFGLVTPLFTQVILDKVVTQRSFGTLNVFAIGLVLFGIWKIGLTAVRQYLLDFFSNRLNLTLVSGFISHALRLPLQFFEQRQVGDIITRVQENQKIQLFLVRQAVSTWLDSIMAIVYMGLMFYYNWRLSLLVIGLIPPIIILTLVATPFLRRISRELFNEDAEQNSLLVEMMTGIATVKATAAEKEIRWRWEERLTRMLNTQFKGQKLANKLQVVGGLINTLGNTALLWYGAMLVIQGQLTIGQFVAFNMLIGNVITPVLSIVDLWDEFQEVLISVERLNDVFIAKPEETPGRPMLLLPSIRGDIRFENVTFRYDQAEERNTLQNISFTVEPGQTIAIVGRSGSGKSTLVKLLQSLYHPVSGRICIDGHDATHVSPESLRSQLGVVPQECFLFSGTILENIQLYRPEFTLEQVVEVAKLAEAHGFIQELPLGYNTKVGERGANLSGGQRQRIAIARALLGNPAILVLDEATSSLDTESERRFQQNLARISRGRTTFVIAHRLSTVRYADQILVLDQGILVEQGTHEELTAQRGLYAHLAQQQLDL